MPGAEYLFSKYMRHGDVTWEYSDCLTYVRTPAPEKQSGRGWGKKKRETERERKKEERKCVFIYIQTCIHICHKPVAQYPLIRWWEQKDFLLLIPSSPLL